MARRSKLSASQRYDFVLRLITKEESCAQLSREAGVSQPTMLRWRDEFLRGGLDAMHEVAGSAGRRGETQRLQKQLSERDQVIGELTVANRILKKNLGSCR